MGRIEREVRGVLVAENGTLPGRSSRPVVWAASTLYDVVPSALAGELAKLG